MSAGTRRDTGGDETTGVFSGAPAPPTRKLRDSAQITNVRPNEDDPRGPDTQVGTIGFPLERGTTLGEFQLVEMIGQGGMGTVYSAIHPMIAKRAAIKVLDLKLCQDRTMVERFIDEARVVNEIGHPNIVDIFAFGEMPDGRRYLAMEFLKGETLRDRLGRGRASLTEMAMLIRPLARALEATHDKGVIHRDLKPENIFLVEVPHDLPHVKLLDFGVAKLAKTADRATRVEGNALLGTPMYISPEQASNANDAGPASDVYSLGAIAFELLTGRPPFLADTTVEMVTKHITNTPVAPSSLVPEIPEEIDQLVLEMLAKAPEDRPSLGHVRSVLALVKDPVELDDKPRTITVRASTPTPVSGSPGLERPDADASFVAVRFAKRSDESVAMVVDTPPPAEPPAVAPEASPAEDLARAPTARAASIRGAAPSRRPAWPVLLALALGGACVVALLIHVFVTDLW